MADPKSLLEQARQDYQERLAKVGPDAPSTKALKERLAALEKRARMKSEAARPKNAKKIPPERKLSPRSGPWTKYFSHTRDDGLGRPGFYVRDSRDWLFTYDGYLGGHHLLDDIIYICGINRFPERSQGADSPLNIANREVFFAFLDGGLEMFEGNYLFGDRGQGAYIRGFAAFRWMLFQLGVPQPRRFRSERVKLDLCRLEEQLQVSRLPFVNIDRSKPNSRQ